MRTELINLTCKSHNRVDSGPVSIDGDWAGIFMRGDEALGFASDLEAMSKIVPNERFASYLKRLADQFASCAQSNFND